MNDNCDSSPVVTQSPAAGTVVTTNTTVTLTVTDASSNSDNCTFDVLLTDNIAPVITSCPSNIVECASNEITQKVEILNIDLNLANYSDNCGGVLTVQYQIKDKDNNILVDFGDDLDGDASGYEFPGGINTVTYRVIDVAGLSSDRSFTVTVSHKPLPGNINF